MRRFSRPLLQKLATFGTEALATETAALNATTNTAQAAGRQSTATRSFSSSKFAQSAATEARVNSVPPYVTYGAVGALAFGGLAYFVASPPSDAARAPVLVSAQVPEKPATAVEVGNFDVLDHTGMHFTQESLQGNFAVLYFGTIDGKNRRERLLQLAEAVMQSDRRSNMHYMIPVFATLDPKKDDVIKMNAMVEDYASALNRKSILNVRLKGVTGDDNQKLYRTAKSYTTKAKETDPEKARTLGSDADFYLVNPELEIIGAYGTDVDPKAIGDELAEIMKAYNISHPSWIPAKAVKTRSA